MWDWFSSTLRQLKPYIFPETRQADRTFILKKTASDLIHLHHYCLHLFWPSFMLYSWNPSSFYPKLLRKRHFQSRSFISCITKGLFFIQRNAGAKMKNHVQSFNYVMKAYLLRRRIKREETPGQHRRPRELSTPSSKLRTSCFMAEYQRPLPAALLGGIMNKKSLTKALQTLENTLKTKTSQLNLKESLVKKQKLCWEHVIWTLPMLWLAGRDLVPYAAYDWLFPLRTCYRMKDRFKTS